jgi:hypothetical protein
MTLYDTIIRLGILLFCVASCLVILVRWVRRHKNWNEKTLDIAWLLFLWNAAIGFATLDNLLGGRFESVRITLILFATGMNLWQLYKNYDDLQSDMRARYKK